MPPWKISGAGNLCMSTVLRKGWTLWSTLPRSIIRQIFQPHLEWGVFNSMLISSILPHTRGHLREHSSLVLFSCMQPANKINTPSQRLYGDALFSLLDVGAPFSQWPAYLRTRKCRCQAQRRGDWMLPLLWYSVELCMSPDCWHQPSEKTLYLLLLG